MLLRLLALEVGGYAFAAEGIISCGFGLAHRQRAGELMAELVEGEAGNTLSGIRVRVPDADGVLNRGHVPVAVIAIRRGRVGQLAAVVRVRYGWQDHRRQMSLRIILVIRRSAHLIGATGLSSHVV